MYPDFSDRPRADRQQNQMSTITLRKLPQELIPILEANEAELEGIILESIVLELVRQQRISTGKAAELLGISKWEFVQLLGQNNIPYFTESSKELVAQVEIVQRILGEQR
ncbi:MAG: UPF0175 family protein [Hormoscilla sp. GM102CHS1]|nr:UPF0175 family protein [Hormoscilla sp. GM102CHS1]